MIDSVGLLSHPHRLNEYPIFPLYPRTRTPS